MQIPKWSEEVIAEKVNNQLVANAHIFPVQIGTEITEYGKFVIAIAKMLLNSLYSLPGGFLLRMVLNEETISALLSILGGAFTAGVLAARAGWFEEQTLQDQREFLKPLDISLN